MATSLFFKDGAYARGWQRTLVLLPACWLAVGSTLSAQEIETREADTLPPEEGEMRFVAETIAIEGDSPGAEASFAARHQRAAGTYGGIEKLVTRGSSGDMNWELDARAMIGEQDYKVRFEADWDGDLKFEFGYQGYRVYDYGAGGFYPPDGVWLELEDPELTLDNHNVFADVAYLFDSGVEVGLRYEYRGRKGDSASTIWGDSLHSVIAGPIGRGYVPTVKSINEDRHVVEGRVTVPIEDGRAGAKLRYERYERDNSTQIERAALDPDTNRFVTQEDGATQDIFAVHGFFERRPSETTLISAGALFTRMDGDLSGSRIYGSSFDALYDVDFARRQSGDSGFVDLVGNNGYEQWLGNLNYASSPGKWLYVAALRLEHLSENANSSYLGTNIARNWTSNSLEAVEAQNEAEAAKSVNDIGLRLETRYKGFQSFLPYVRLEYAHNQGDLSERWTSERLTPTQGSPEQLLDRASEWDRNTWKATLGATWYPTSKMNIGMQAYYKGRESDYDHASVGRPATDWTRYPAFIDKQAFETWDGNVRLTMRLPFNLNSVSRFDYQYSTIDTTPVGLPRVDSSETTSWIASQTLTWTPHARFFLQGQVNYVNDTTETPASDIIGIWEDIVRDVSSDYWNATFLAYFVVTKHADLQLRYTYFDADNFEDNSDMSMPYGVSETEHNAGADLFFHFSENLVFSVHYTFYDYSDDTSGGYADFRGHAVACRLQQRF